MTTASRLKTAASLLAAAILVLGAASTASAANLLTNGSFESTGSGWHSPWYFVVKSGGGGSLSQTSATKVDGSYSAVAGITQASSSAPWLVQLSQSRLPVTAGQTYTVSFAAKASAGRPLDAVLQNTDSPWEVYAGKQVALTTAWQSYSFTYQATASDSDVSLHFNLAGATGSVWVDKVAIEAASPPPETTKWIRSPVADASVRADFPATNYARAPTLVSDGDPAAAAYMRWDLATLAGRTITKATLRTWVVDATASTQTLRVAPTDWTESGITYQNWPALGTALATFTAPTAGTWKDVDVSSVLADKAGRQVAFGIESTGADAYAFYSRNGPSNRVRLIVESRAGTTPPPTEGKGIALRPFAQYWGSNLAGMNSDFADMNAGDIDWARIDLYKTDSPDPNLDAAVQAAKNHNVKLVMTVRKPWPDKDLGTEADRAAYRAWLGEMVNRYKHYVRYWEIHNEPNLHYEWNIDEEPGSDQAQYEESVRRYVLHLKDGYETIKANDPGAIVLFGGLSEWRVERYMDFLVTTDAYKYFDLMSFHPYGYNPDRVLSRFNSFKSKMNLNANYAAKPIWVTEIGFNTSWTNKAGYVTSEQQKADYLVSTMQLLKGAGAELPIFWYTLHENDYEGGYALTLKDRATLGTQYLPAFYAYRDLSL